MITHLPDNDKNTNVCHAMFYRLTRPLEATEQRPINNEYVNIINELANCHP